MSRKSSASAPCIILPVVIAIALMATAQMPEAKHLTFKHQLAAYKNFIDRTVSTERIEEHLRYFTAEPHVAASPRNDELARYVHGKWKEFGLEDVALATYDVLFPTRDPSTSSSSRRASCGSRSKKKDTPRIRPR